MQVLTRGLVPQKHAPGTPGFRLHMLPLLCLSHNLASSFLSPHAKRPLAVIVLDSQRHYLIATVRGAHFLRSASLVLGPD